MWVLALQNQAVVLCWPLPLLRNPGGLQPLVLVLVLDLHEGVEAVEGVLDLAVQKIQRIYQIRAPWRQAQRGH